MNTLSASCTGCGQRYALSPDKAGRRFACKKCGQPVHVPQVEGAPPPLPTPVLAQGQYALPSKQPARPLPPPPKPHSNLLPNPRSMAPPVPTAAPHDSMQKGRNEPNTPKKSRGLLLGGVVIALLAAFGVAYVLVFVGEEAVPQPVAEAPTDTKARENPVLESVARAVSTPNIDRLKRDVDAAVRALLKGKGILDAGPDGQWDGEVDRSLELFRKFAIEAAKNRIRLELSEAKYAKARERAIQEFSALETEELLGLAIELPLTGPDQTVYVNYLLILSLGIFAVERGELEPEATYGADAAKVCGQALQVTLTFARARAARSELEGR